MSNHSFEWTKISIAHDADHVARARAEAEKLHRVILGKHGRAATEVDGMGKEVDVDHAFTRRPHLLHASFWLDGDYDGPGIVGIVVSRPGEVGVGFHHRWPFR